MTAHGAVVAAAFVAITSAAVVDAAVRAAPQCSLPLPASGFQCWGLTHLEAGDSSLAACREACCALTGGGANQQACHIYQYCDPSAPCADSDNVGSSSTGCWVGNWTTVQVCRTPGDGGAAHGWEGACTERPTALHVNASAPIVPGVPVAPHCNGTSPTGSELGYSGRALTINGKAWFSRGGSLHYARVPASEWRDSLLRMKAGGLDTVQTYVFWIHHEETHGVWDWSGRRSLRNFAALVGSVGMKMMLRMGPWSHGEARQGGFPDWLQALGDQGKIKLRSTDPGYLAYVKTLVEQVAAQVKGLMWSDGGPIWGIQVDNEYSGPAAYLTTLKQMALDAGICPPYFLKTGWPATSTPVPAGALLPLLGGYVDQFWSRSLSYQSSADSYVFTPARDSASNPPEYAQLGVEIGGGMATAYHRRVVDLPSDTPAAVVASKLGNGMASVGYYVYRGGTNPLGTTYLEETQATHGDNDLPVRSYDYAAPLSEFGAVREHYHGLRALHMWLADADNDMANPSIADMPAFAPDAEPFGSWDNSTLRWAVRSDGHSGVILINNYQRHPAKIDGAAMPAHSDVRLAISLSGGTDSRNGDRGSRGGTSLQVPAPGSRGFAVPSNATMMWPFNWMVGGHGGVRLAYATAHALMTLEDIRTPAGQHYDTVMLLSQSSGVDTELALDASDVATVLHTSVPTSTEGGQIIARDIPPSSDAALVVSCTSGVTVAFVVLNSTAGARMYAGELGGRTRAVISATDDVVFDEGQLVLRTSNTAATASVLPALAAAPAPAGVDGLFSVYAAPASAIVTPPAVTASATLVAHAGPARNVSMGRGNVAAEPSDADFDAAAVWNVTVSLRDGKAPPESVEVWTCLRYTGDVARLYLAGTLLTDNQFSGRPFCVQLSRYADDGVFDTGALLQLKVLPLRRDAPIYLLDWPAFPDDVDAVVSLDGIDVTVTQNVQVPKL